MSNSDQLFFDPGHRVAVDAARELAGALGWTLNVERRGATVSTQRISDDLPFPMGGEVEENIYSDIEPLTAAEEAAYDGLPLVWSVWTPGGVDRDDRRRADVAVLRRLAERSPNWPVVLTFDYALLGGIYDPAGGLRLFPPDTFSDGTARSVWGPRGPGERG